MNGGLMDIGRAVTVMGRSGIYLGRAPGRRDRHRVHIDGEGTRIVRTSEIEPRGIHDEYRMHRP